MARGCSDSSWALMQALVREHTPRVVQALMIQSVSGDVPSYYSIRQARNEFLAAESPPEPRLAPQAAMPRPVRKPPRPPLTHDERMARVAAGARLITIHPLRKPDPAFTLGGVGSASL